MAARLLRRRSDRSMLWRRPIETNSAHRGERLPRQVYTLDISNRQSERWSADRQPEASRSAGASAEGVYMKCAVMVLVATLAFSATAAAQNTSFATAVHVVAGQPASRVTLATGSAERFYDAEV